jgi:hypothetical protein
MHIPDTSAKFTEFVYRYKYSVRFRQCAWRYDRREELPAREMTLNRLSRDLQEKVLLAFSELEHLEWEHDDAAFFGAESAGDVAVL